MKKRAKTQSKTPATPQQAALAAECTKLRDLFERALRDDARGRYAIAVAVKAIKDDEARYGEKAVNKLAKQLHRSQSLLYSYCRVADAWDPDAFGALAKRKTQAGEVLSYSHFECIAAENDPEVRGALLERAFSENLSVGALTRARRGGNSRKPASSSFHGVIQHAARIAILLDADAEFVETRAPRSAEDREAAAKALEVYRSLSTRVAELASSLANFSTSPSHAAE